MIIVPVNTNVNMSPKAWLAMLIVFNVIIAILGIIAYNYYSQETYPGNFWEWSWDGMAGLMHGAHNDWGMIFWTAFLIVDGVALFTILGLLVAYLLGEE